MKSTYLFALLEILLWRSHIFSFVYGATDSVCSLSREKDAKSTEPKVYSETDIIGKNGILSSPGYPKMYPSDSEYLWRITVPENNDIILEFESFEVENHEQCAYDYVEVRDGLEPNSPLLNKVCGNFTGLIRSSANQLSVKFVTDGSVQKMGFAATFKIGSCSTEIRSTEGTFHSTNYPHQYLPHTDCTWKIVAPKDHIVIIRFRFFEVENHDQCAYDYLEIRDGSETDGSLLGRICGKNVSEHVYLSSSGNVITAKFVTDGSVQETGFEAEFNTVLCGGDIVADKGKVFSPSFLGKYLRDLDCTWNIASHKGGPVSLKFKSFELDGSNRCTEDYVEVRDGGISDGKRIGKFCGRNVPEYIVSTGNSLSIRFVSDGTGEKAGFLAEYNSDFCVHDVPSESRKIENYSCGYKPNTECVWRIRVPDGLKIGMKFNKLEMEGNDQCSFDYVAIYDSYDLKSRLLGKFCGAKVPEEYVFSPRNKMVVKFVTDGSIQKSGFSSEYTTVSCGPSLLSIANQRQIFSSPGYPLLYPTHMTCSWNFHITQPLYKVKMQLIDVDIPCTDDNYIEISTPKEVSLPYRVCRNNSAYLHDVISTGDVRITFHSGPSGKGRGFRLDYVIADCQLNYTKDNGLLLSPKYPVTYLPHWRCATSIDTSAGNTISLYFGNFLVRRRDVSSDRACQHASLKVYDGIADDASLLANLCGSSVPSPVFSTGNRIIMVLRTYDNADAHYSISYTTTNKGPGCGGLLSNTNGTFTSPLYPRVYREAKSCIWNMSVPSFHSMTFRFSFFELTSDAHCSTNYVELYEGHDEVQSRKVYRRCGNVLPVPYKSQSNVLMLNLVTDRTNKGSGFVAHFQMNPHGDA